MVNPLPGQKHAACENACLVIRTALDEAHASIQAAFVGIEQGFIRSWRPLVSLPRSAIQVPDARATSAAAARQICRIR